MSGQPAAPLLSVQHLRKTFVTGDGRQRRRVVALDDVSFDLQAGQVIAVVGESGSGKSTLARVITGLIAPDAGQVNLSGQPLVTHTRRPQLSDRKQLQMVFQDPFASLNPVHTVGYHLRRPLLRHAMTNGKAECERRVIELLDAVGLSPGDEFQAKFPHELSGGQRQRVAIARALAPEPQLVIADEPTSMLDVSIRMGILNLMLDLGRKRGLSYLMITHDLASARYVADVILVMYGGKIVEQGATETVLSQPTHEYTKRLLAAVPDAHGSLRAAGQ